MKKILLIIVLVSGQMRAAQVGLSQQRITTPMEQLQEQYRNAPVKASAYTLEQEAGQPDIEYAPRGLLIFLDEPREYCLKKEAVSLDLTEAIIQKAGPIIVSANILRSVLKDYLPPSERTMYGKTVSYVKSFFSKESKSEKAFNSCEILISKNFDSSEWIIKEVSKELYCMLPYTYLDMVKVALADVQKENASSITPTELTLGLKVNHMRNVDIREISTAQIIPSDRSYFVRALTGGNLFCERAAYQESYISRPLWTWYMMGHGFVSQYIVGMPIEDFKKVLTFITDHLTMRLLVYQTCYGAGLNTELVYNDEKTNMQRAYPFTIVTQAITDASVAQLVLSYGVKRERPRDFSTFTKYGHDNDIDYEKVIKTVFHIAPDPFYKGNIAQIKLPGIEWFSVVAGKNDVVGIGTIMAKTRSKPLDIHKWFKAENPRALLLETTYIPFEIIINVPHLEYIISVVAGETNTYIEAITSSVYDINQILNTFQRIELSAGIELMKKIYISRITALNDQGQPTEYKDIIIAPNNNVYYTQGADIFFKRPDQKAVSTAQESDLFLKIYNKQVFDFIKSQAQRYAKKSSRRATEKTEGLSPESISKLENVLKTRDISKATAVGALAKAGK